MTITLVIIIFPDFYQKYYFCLKIVFNSLAFQKMKSIFRYFNLNAYEHLNVSAYGMKNYPKNVFDVSRLKACITSHKILSSI